MANRQELHHVIATAGVILPVVVVVVLVLIVVVTMVVAARVGRWLWSSLVDCCSCFFSCLLRVFPGSIIIPFCHGPRLLDIINGIIMDSG